METGYLAEYQSAEDLARGIAWALQADIPRQQLRQHAARHFSGDAVASQYIRLYKEITAENGK
jgi:glycosyltransferase involved in cell wall biosynthesis